MKAIYNYTKQNAIEDGSQVDITNHTLTKEAGFTIPVYLTKSVYKIIEVPEDTIPYQDFEGRLWDLLIMASRQFRVFQNDKHLVPFKTIFEISRNKRKTIQFWLVFNEYEGFTIMLPEEY